MDFHHSSRMYAFLEEAIRKEYRIVKTIKENKDKSIRKVCHVKSGEYFLVRRFAGSAEGYRALLPVKSSYLPEIFEVASENDRVLVIEEYVPGDPLDELMQGVTFSAKETSKIAADICKALYILHRAGIVHRDVKPGNIRIREGSDTAVLMDFDSSRTIKTDRSQDTVLLGTAGYAAPEQYGISQTDGRADIYALGVTMNLMLTGAHPSEKLAEGKMGRIISKCVMVHPDKRYHDVLRLMEALG